MLTWLQLDDERMLLLAHAWLAGNGYDRYEMGATAHVENTNVWDVEVKIPDGTLLLLLIDDGHGVVSVQKTRNFERLLSDSMQLSDSLVKSRHEKRLLSDSMQLSDSLVKSRNFERLLSDSMQLSDSLVKSRHEKRSLSDSLSISDSLEGIHAGTRHKTSLFAGLALGAVVGLDLLSQSGDSALVTVQGLLAFLGFMAGYFSIKRIRTKTTKNGAVLQDKTKSYFTRGFLLFLGIVVVQIYIVGLYHEVVQVPIAALLALMSFISGHYVFSMERFTRYLGGTRA